MIDIKACQSQQEHNTKLYMFRQFLQKNSAELVKMQIGKFCCKETKQYLFSNNQNKQLRICNPKLRKKTTVLS